MKTLTLLFGAALLAALSANAADTPAAAPTPESTPPVASPAAPVAPESKPAPPAVVEAAPAPAAPETIQTNNLALTDTNLLRLNFRGAPLDTVLNYLSEAAGFIINLEATPRGRVDVWSATAVTREEAMELLDSVLRKNGLAAIRNGRTLTIVNRDEAKIHSIPVKLGSDPQTIPRTDEIVTQILPVRYVEVAQLVKDIQPLVSMQTTITANEAGNSLVITDSQANIRRIAEIIQAIDMGAEDVTEVHVFRLQYSDPTEMADLLTSLFPDESRSSSQSGQGGFRGFFGRFGPPGMMGNSSSSSSTGAQTQRVKRRARVLAVPDPRTASLVVTAAKDLMPQIEDVVKELDSNPARKQSVHVYQLQNADAEEVQQVLQDMFERNSTSSNRRQSQSSTLSNRRTTQENSNNSRNSSRNNSSNGSFGR